MSISLSSAMISALGVNYPSPGVFVELGFSTPVRIHDRQGTKSWNSLSWLAANVSVSGFSVENGAAQRCSLAIVDHDNAIAQQCRDQTGPGYPDITVKAWLFDATALATGDPLKIFDGVMGASSGGDNRRLRIDCVVPTVWLPRGMLANLLPAYMFMPEGTEVAFGNGKIVAQRRGEYA